MSTLTKTLGLILILEMILSAQAVSVSTILEDNVTIENNLVIHKIQAFRGIENLTLVDYFSEVKTRESIEGESFLGREWWAVRIEIGNLKQGEKVIQYDIIQAKGEALLGADTYYLEGEKHQLFPKKVILDITEENDRAETVDITKEENKSETGRDLYILWIVPSLFLLFLALKLLKR